MEYESILEVPEENIMNHGDVVRMLGRSRLLWSLTAAVLCSASLAQAQAPIMPGGKGAGVSRAAIGGYSVSGGALFKPFDAGRAGTLIRLAGWLRHFDGVGRIKIPPLVRPLTGIKREDTMALAPLMEALPRSFFDLADTLMAQTERPSRSDSDARMEALETSVSVLNDKIEQVADDLLKRARAEHEKAKGLGNAAQLREISAELESYSRLFGNTAIRSEQERIKQNLEIMASARVNRMANNLGWDKSLEGLPSNGVNAQTGAASRGTSRGTMSLKPYQKLSGPEVQQPGIAQPMASQGGARKPEIKSSLKRESAFMLSWAYIIGLGLAAALGTGALFMASPWLGAAAIMVVPAAAILAFSFMVPVTWGGIDPRTIIGLGTFALLGMLPGLFWGLSPWQAMGSAALAVAAGFAALASQWLSVSRVSDAVRSWASLLARFLANAAVWFLALGAAALGVGALGMSIGATAAVVGGIAVMSVLVLLLVNGAQFFKR